MINIDEIKPARWRYPFPTIDFKFQNTGSATAFLWKFEIKVIQAEIDLTPVLDFRANVKDKALELSVTNDGWGKARDLRLNIDEKTISRVFPASTRQFQGDIESGQTENIIRLSPDKLDTEQLKLLSGEFTRFEDEDSYWRYRDRRLENFSERLEGVKIGNLQAECEYRDEREKKYKENKSISTSSSTHFTVLTADGFVKIPEPPSVGQAAPSDATFITIIDPAKGSHEVSYPISRKIPVGDIERFHIMVGAKMSCRLKLQFRFYIDKNQRIDSEIFEINIWNPRNRRWHEDFIDGDELSREIDRLEKQLQESELESYSRQYKEDNLRRRKEQYSNFPFLSEENSNEW